MPIETAVGIPMALSLGLMYGLGPCLVSCLPYLGPVFLARDFGVRRSWRVVLPLSLGRLLGYAGIALAAGLAGHAVTDGAAAPALRLLVGSAAVMVGLALVWRRPACATAAGPTAPLRRIDIGAKDIAESAGTVRAKRADQSPPPRGGGWEVAGPFAGSMRGHSTVPHGAQRFIGAMSVKAEPRPLLPGGLFLMGLSMAMTPCAPLGVVLFSAAASASAGHGALLGLGFGLGAIVVPTLVYGVGAAYLGARLREQFGAWRPRIELASAGLLILTGASHLLKAL
jgi:uncharacterized protein